jgi:hypothetical protein
MKRSIALRGARAGPPLPPTAAAAGSEFVKLPPRTQ